MKKPLTPNQMHFLRIAVERAPKAVDITGMCLNGQFSGRGRGTVLKSLEAKDLITIRIQNVGIRRPLYHECIRATPKGIALYAESQEQQKHGRKT